MRVFWGAVLVWAACVWNCWAQVDHLQPVLGTLFESSNEYQIMARVRETLMIDEESREKRNLIQIVAVVGYPLPTVNLLELVRFGDMYSGENIRFSLVFRSILNPKVIFDKAKPSNVKLEERQVPIDAALAKRMIAVWSAMINRTRYVVSSDSSQSALDGNGYEIHYVYTLGERMQSGVVPNVSGGPVATLSVTVNELREWVRSNSNENSSKAIFLKDLEKLEKYYLNHPDKKDGS